uniref:Uncharacterized protein n=1 Tax=Bartonella schoenbuchensis (strain DSM 13525 / NCTC 13165 / R1) TaxID=687861 RepID=E6YYW1_BARSR|nr:hypothetical protein B11C_20400 [Bartonella schoenbuchensis R1]
MLFTLFLKIGNFFHIYRPSQAHAAPPQSYKKHLHSKHALSLIKLSNNPPLPLFRV